MWTTLFIKMWRGCVFVVNCLYEKRFSTGPLTTYTHGKTHLFQLVICVVHTTQKRYGYPLSLIKRAVLCTPVDIPLVFVLFTDNVLQFMQIFTKMISVFLSVHKKEKDLCITW